MLATAGGNPVMSRIDFRAAILQATAAVFVRLGLPVLVQRLFYRNRLTILMYHGLVRSASQAPSWMFIDAAAFRQQMHYVKKHFEVISLTQAVKELNERKTYDRPPAVITFDDGYYSNYEVAFGILERERLPATVFLTTGLLETGTVPWFCRLEQAFDKTSASSVAWRGTTYSLQPQPHGAPGRDRLKNALKRLPHAELEAELGTILDRLDVEVAGTASRGSDYAMLDQPAIDRMLASGLVEFGAHTRTHAILSQTTDDERQVEIERSIADVAKLTGKPCTLFAYPNGKADDYDRKSIQALRACGIQAAVTTIGGPNGPETSPMELRRHGIGGHWPFSYFKMRVHHVSHLLRGGFA